MELRKIWFIAMCFTLVIGVTSCADAPAKATQESTIVDIEHNSKYVCPMRCEGSGSTEPGECPVCHMKYVENEDYKAPK